MIEDKKSWEQEMANLKTELEDSKKEKLEEMKEKQELISYLTEKSYGLGEKDAQSDLSEQVVGEVKREANPTFLLIYLQLVCDQFLKIRKSNQKSSETERSRQH